SARAAERRAPDGRVISTHREVVSPPGAMTSYILSGRLAGPASHVRVAASDVTAPVESSVRGGR
ncbi:MAG TPA: hypothetical protein VFI52_07570, partial [Gemmatimonadaceae bacterium]|nr:hypothetical protein [Gemmatimonadaceae bacterium]